MHRCVSLMFLLTALVACQPAGSDEEKWMTDGRFGLPCEPSASPDETRAGEATCHVSAIQLMANLERYHEHRISVPGVLLVREGVHYLQLIGCIGVFVEEYSLELIDYKGWIPPGSPLLIEGDFDAKPQYGKTVGALSGLGNISPTLKHLSYDVCREFYEEPGEPGDVKSDTGDASHRPQG